jgi:hypothetical protein
MECFKHWQSEGVGKIVFILLAWLAFAIPAGAQRLVSERLLTGLRQPALSVYRLQVTPTDQLLVQGTSTAVASTPGASACNLLWNDNFLLSNRLDTIWAQRGPALNSGWTDLTWDKGGDFTVFGDQKYVPAGATNCTGRNFFIGRYAPRDRSPRHTQAFNIGTRLNRVGKLTPATDGGYLISASSSGTTRQSWQLIKTDSVGTVQWTKNYGISFSEIPFLLQTSCRSTGRVLMAGTGQYGYPYDVFQLRLLLVNQAGDSLRNAFINPLPASWTISSVSNHISPLRDGGFLIPVQADSTSASGAVQSMPLLLRVDSLLNVRWFHLERTTAAQSVQYGGKMCELADGSVLALLAAKNSASAAGQFAVQRLDGATGVVTVRYPFTSTICSAVSSYDLVPTSDGHTLYVGGSCFTSTGSRGYVAVIDLQNLPAVIVPLATTKKEEKTAFTLVPNPTQGTATLTWSLPAGVQAGQLQFYTTLGQLARQIALPAGSTGTVEVGGLAAGTYLARLLDSSGLALGRAQRQVVLP